MVNESIPNWTGYSLLFIAFGGAYLSLLGERKSLDKTKKLFGRIGISLAVFGLLGGLANKFFDDKQKKKLEKKINTIEANTVKLSSRLVVVDLDDSIIKANLLEAETKLKTLAEKNQLLASQMTESFAVVNTLSGSNKKAVMRKLSEEMKVVNAMTGEDQQIYDKLGSSIGKIQDDIGKVNGQVAGIKSGVSADMDSKFSRP